MKKMMYYILNCTWGCIMTFIGALIAFVLICIGKTPKKHGGCIYFNVGERWGGMELGLFFLTDSHDVTSTKNHEFGHSLQNCIWGPLFPFIICIPSATRYWLREQKTIEDKKKFTYIVAAIAGIVSLALIIIGLFTLLPLSIIGLFLFIYSTLIVIWLLEHEIPKYVNGKSVPYDSIWFEGQATEWGTAHIKDFQ